MGATWWKQGRAALLLGLVAATSTLSSIAASATGPTVELSDLIWAAMLPAGDHAYSWDFLPYLPIRWKDRDPSRYPGGGQRSGNLAIRVHGSLTERLDGEWATVPWEITLNARGPQDAPATLVMIANDGGPQLDCLKLVPLYEMRNCQFKISDALGPKFTARRLCSGPNGDGRLVRYLLTAPGKSESVAAFSTPKGNEAVADAVTVEPASPRSMSCGASSIR